jgi:Fe-S cluster biosynthesis and repair protein YggX
MRPYFFAIAPHRQGAPSQRLLPARGDCLGIRRALLYLEFKLSNMEVGMAEENCSSPQGAGAGETAQPGQRMVHCVKFGREMPGLDRPPWKGELGKKVYENVSKEAWKLWIEYSKMLMNEYRLNPLDPNSQKFVEEQMDNFFFGEGAKLPEGYVPPKTKS